MATYDCQQRSNGKTLKYKNALSLKRRKHKNLDDEQYGQQREQPVGMLAPQSP